MNLHRVLALTSPMMHGDDVLHAQRMLKSTAPGTPYGNYQPGPTDGYFGQLAASACERAKYWLGYPEADIKRTYGQKLEDWLGGKPLPLEFRTRRANRIKKALETPSAPLRIRALNLAKGEIGTHESPTNSNRVKYSEWYGIIGPWCAMFATWCYVKAGSTESFRLGRRYSYVPAMVDDARGRDWHLARITKDSVAPGDIVTFDWEGGGVGGPSSASDHTGLFEFWLDKNRGVFQTVEGNTAIGNNSNGGQVMRRERYMSEVSCFIRADV